jgi:hypothetical protein
MQNSKKYAIAFHSIIGGVAYFAYGELITIKDLGAFEFCYN